MKSILMAIGAVVLLSGCAAQEVAGPGAEVSAPVNANEVTFDAADGGVVYADLLVTEAGKSAPLIMLFHQAGANGRAEYEAIFPKLRDEGYNLLVVDQRSGGNHFGGHNRTVEARGGKTGYCPAYVDLEATLAFADSEGFDGSRFAWGSSYSAGLVLKLAVEHGDDLSGVLSFSPANGRAMGECTANNYITSVDIPAIGLRPASEMNTGGKAQHAMFVDAGLDFYIAEKGVHGSSMLDPGRAGGDVAPTWDAVWTFLNVHK